MPRGGVYQLGGFLVSSKNSFMQVHEDSTVTFSTRRCNSAPALLLMQDPKVHAMVDGGSEPSIVGRHHGLPTATSDGAEGELPKIDSDAEGAQGPEGLTEGALAGAQDGLPKGDSEAGSAQSPAGTASTSGSTQGEFHQDEFHESETEAESAQSPGGIPAGIPGGVQNKARRLCPSKRQRLRKFVVEMERRITDSPNMDLGIVEVPQFITVFPTWHQKLDTHLQDFQRAVQASLAAQAPPDATSTQPQSQGGLP